MASVGLGYTVKYKQIQFSLTLRGRPSVPSLQRASRTDIQERAHIYFLRCILFRPYITSVMEANWFSESEAIERTVAPERGLAGGGTGGSGGECG